MDLLRPLCCARRRRPGCKHPGCRRMTIQSRGTSVCRMAPVLILVVSAAVLLQSASLCGQERHAPTKLSPDSSCVAKECHGQLVSASFVHRPAKETCDACHEQDDETRHEFAYPDEGSELCYACHNSVTKKKFVHDPLKKAKRPCVSCHDPHSGASKHMLKAKTTSSQCLTCHVKDVKSRSDRVIKGLGGQLVEGARLHGPLESQDCAGCHEPHGSAQFGFLAKAYPSTFYSPYKKDAYSLCFSCHDPSLVAKAQAAGATNFRDGNANLHYLHVNKKAKGRTCRACHATHASKTPHMLADSVPFGQWKIPIRFVEEKNGGSCASGCHQKKTYSRAPSSADEKLPQPKTSAEQVTPVKAATNATTMPEGSAGRNSRQ